MYIIIIKLFCHLCSPLLYQALHVVQRHRISSVPLLNFYQTMPNSHVIFRHINMGGILKSLPTSLVVRIGFTYNQQTYKVDFLPQLKGVSKRHPVWGSSLVITFKPLHLQFIVLWVRYSRGSKSQLHRLSGTFFVWFSF